MAGKDKPFSNAFEELQSLKKRLPKDRKAAEESKAPPPPPEPEEPAPEPDPDFAEVMDEMGVDRLGAGTERVATSRPIPDPSAGAAGPKPKRTVHSGLRGVADGWDESTPRMDLHGMGVDDAVAEVQRRVRLWRQAGVTKARIVTGRGSHSGDGVAAIREAVESWLRRAPGAVGVYRARPDAGGEGVLLFEQLGRGKRA